MTYCTKCGKQNLDTAKFCTGCGGVLVLKEQTSRNPISEAAPTTKERFLTPQKRISSITLLLAGILVVGAGTAAYFIFFNKKKTPPTVTTVETKETPVQTTPVVSDAVPLKPGNQTNELTISQIEVNNVSRRIDEFYGYEKDENVTSLLSYYRFPLDRYYQFYNVGYDKLYKMVVEAFNGKLYYHNIDIKWNYSSVQKLGSGGYKALLFAEYTSASQAADDRRTQNLHLTIIMNDNYEITSIYPN